MAQIFPKSMNYLARLTLIGTALGTPVFAWFCLMYTHSSYGTNAGVMREQPIPFSHQHHVGVLGIDCRYCHTSVEKSSFAGLPATQICMNCHSQMWVGSEMLGPVRASYRTSAEAPKGRPLHWQRVYNLPGFVYFDHSIHVRKGIGCSSCHGRIDEMPLTYQEPSLLMAWCLDCHRHPEQRIRPREEVFNMSYRPPTPEQPVAGAVDQSTLGRRLCKEYKVKNSSEITSCTVCHR